MPLHSQAAAFLEQVALLNSLPIESTPINWTRRALLLASGVKRPAPELANVQTIAITGPDGDSLRLRIYHPRTTPVGACLYFHGGGWVLNSIDTHDDLARRLTAASSCVFVSVDYRLAPEHKYPAAIEDAYAALQWLSARADELNFERNRIAVCGDSAGGNIAAALCLMTRDRGGPKVSFQALSYPVTDSDLDRPSYHKNADGYFLTRSQMVWFWDQYVCSRDQMSEPYASPLRATSLSGLPAALIQTAEFDPLCDEGQAYADVLRTAGIPVQFHRYDGMIHAFVKRVDQFDAALEAIQEIGDALRNHFQGR